MKEKFKDYDDIKGIEGRYADAFRVGHSAFKFVLDFGQFTFDAGAMRFHTRVILSPDTAKHLHEMIGDSIREYKEQNDFSKTD